MTAQDSRFARLILSVALCLAGATVWALDPGQPPGGNFDLSHWYLGLPVDSSGGTNGTSASILAATLTNGYTSEWFYTGPDGAMTFWAWVVGATTSGSSYPRSELREQISPPNNSVNWYAYGTHILDAQCKVLQVPSTKDVCIGQIHGGYTGQGLPLLLIHYIDGQQIQANIRTNATDPNAKTLKQFFGTSSLNTNISYVIKIENGLLRIVVNSITNSVNIFQTDPGWATNDMYFKAGDYCQDNAGPTNEGARVAFYALSLYHAPSITNQPASQVVTVGSNVTFRVGALGNPPLKYAWRLNSTPINNATNGSLSIPNAQLTNAGNYSVIVTDFVGSVTSSVATLTVLLPAPAAPGGLTATALSETQVRLSWTDNATNETAYGVERSLESNSWSILTASLPANTTNYTDATGSPLTLYYYRVNCTNAGGASVYAVISLTTPAGVGDGIPGWWRIQYSWNGLTTNSSSCATCDPDGDGQDNLAEYLAGTDPTNNTSTFRITAIAQEDNDIRLTWTMGAGKTNALERSDGGAGGSYSNNFTAIFTVTNTVGSVTNYLDISPATNNPTLYYRIRLVP